MRSESLLLELGKNITIKFEDVFGLILKCVKASLNGLIRLKHNPGLY
jgi:hypothetical protein